MSRFAAVALQRVVSAGWVREGMVMRLLRSWAVMLFMVFVLWSGKIGLTVLVYQVRWGLAKSTRAMGASSGSDSRG